MLFNCTTAPHWTHHLRMESAKKILDSYMQTVLIAKKHLGLAFEFIDDGQVHYRNHGCRMVLQPLDLVDLKFNFDIVALEPSMSNRCGYPQSSQSRYEDKFLTWSIRRIHYLTMHCRSAPRGLSPIGSVTNCKSLKSKSCILRHYLETTDQKL